METYYLRYTLFFSIFIHNLFEEKFRGRSEIPNSAWQFPCKRVGHYTRHSETKQKQTEYIYFINLFILVVNAQ